MEHASNHKTQGYKTRRNTRETFCDVGLSKDSLDMTPKAQFTKQKNS